MKVLPLVAMMLLCACGKTKYISTSDTKSQVSIKSKDVRICMSEEELPYGSVERIGLITSHKKNEHKAFKKARKEAAQHGADVILFIDGKELSAGQKVANTLLWPGLHKAKWRFYAYRSKGN